MRYSSGIRFIDWWLGSVVCFLFTLVHALRRRSKDKTIKNILVIELFEMGASIMAYSSLAYLKKTVPDANIYCLCLESTKEPWLMLDALKKEDVFAIDNRNLLVFVFSTLKQIRAISRKRIDIIIDFELFTRISSIMSFLIRSKFRAGFYSYTMEGLYRGNFLDVKCYYNQNMHISKNLLALTKSAVPMSDRYYNFDGPIPTDEIVIPSYIENPALRETVRRKIIDRYAPYKGQPLILIAPTVGSVLPMRDYPKDQYVEVIRELRSIYASHLIVLIGTREHQPATAYIHDRANDDRCIDFAGDTASLSELMELFGMADLLIASDSGNSHFAAMTNLKNVALYGIDTPFVYGPLGKSVCFFEFFHTSPSNIAYNHKNPPNDTTNCVKIIAPHRIVAMAKLLMEGKARYGTINNEIPYIL
jgi:ADP-heptose:LPS heptosyltransferase